MRSREEREKFVRTPRGAPRRPLTPHEINAKFLDTAGVALGRDAAEELMDRLWRLPEVGDVREVFRDVI
jgi:2-methylcitrate dehydratase PrpD